MFAGAHSSYLRALHVAGLIVATWFTVLLAGPQYPPASAGRPAEKARIGENYGKLPLSFEANTGQANSAVKFFSRGKGYTLFLTGDEAVLALKKSEVRSQKSEAFQDRLLPGRLNLEELLNNKDVKKPQDRGAGPALRMRLVGANPAAKVTGAEELPGKANYLIGNDPAKWRTHVPTYAKVKYQDVYPGIDLAYYGNPSADGQLEFDFVVAPGADPSAIALAVDAAGRVVSKQKAESSGPARIDSNGDLVVHMDGGGDIHVRKPLVYQVQESGFGSQGPGAKEPQQRAANNRKSAITNRKSIEAHFVLDAQNHVQFALGPYDHAKALVIDPALAFSTFLGGSGNGGASNAIAMDTAGNVYVTGSTCSTDFPVTPGAFQTANPAVASNGCTAFVTKLNATGTALVYSTYLGGSGSLYGRDIGHAIAVDTAGNVYVAGQTYSTDFPVTQGAFQTTNRAAANSDANAFVTKLNPTGSALVYSTYLGGSGLSAESPYSGDEASSIAIDAAGDAYVAGQTGSTDFPVTPGAFQSTNHAAANERTNAFVAKLNPTGTALLYSTYLGGSPDNRLGFMGDIANAMAVDAAGDAFVTGQAGSADFPVTSGAYQTTNKAAPNEGTNAFVTEVNPTGTALVYSTYLGGSSSDSGSAIAVDAAGNVYVAGQTSSTDFPVTPGAFQTTNHASNNGANAFITKLNPAGAALVYSTYLGGSGGAVNLMPTLAMWGGDVASGLATDSSGDVYVTGSTASADFPVTPGAYQTTNNDQPPCAGGCIGGYNAFITELNSTGSALVYSTYLGGNGINPLDFVGVLEFGYGDQANALALDDSGNLYVTGSAVSYDFPVTGGAFQTTVNSWFGNAFVTKLNMGATSPELTPTVTVTPATSTITSARPLTVTVSVSGGSGNPTPTGTVTLASGTYASSATTLSDGIATINIPAGALLAEPAGYSSADVLVSRYVPDAASSSTYNFSSGVGTVYVVAPNITVTPSSTTLTWAQSQSQALSVAMAATGGAGNPVPTGTVTLTTGSYSSAASALSGGNATISIPPATLTTGFNVLNVSYSGDSNYAPESPAGSALVIVGSVTVSVVPSSSTISSGQALLVTITVSAGSGSPTPTGMVTLISGSYISPTTPLAGGSATITIPAGTLPPGVDILEVDYGDGNYGGASGQATVTVTGGTPGLTITGTAVTVTPGATTGNVSFVTLTPSGGFAGSVALTAAVTSSPSGAQDPPTLSFGGNSPVSISGAAPVVVPLTIATTAPNTCVAAYQTPRGVFWYTGGGAALACVLLFGIPVKRRRWRLALAMLALLVALMGGLLACGGSSTIKNCGPIIPGTTTGTYTITVTGTSGATTATGTVALTVQ